jgi:hypothetical protein
MDCHIPTLSDPTHSARIVECAYLIDTDDIRDDGVVFVRF